MSDYGLAWYWYVFGVLFTSSPLIVGMVYMGFKYGWSQYWTAGDEGPW